MSQSPSLPLLKYLRIVVSVVVIGVDGDNDVGLGTPIIVLLSEWPAQIFFLFFLFIIRNFIVVIGIAIGIVIVAGFHSNMSKSKDGETLLEQLFEEGIVRKLCNSKLTGSDRGVGYSHSLRCCCANFDYLTGICRDECSPSPS